MPPVTAQVSWYTVEKIYSLNQVNEGERNKPNMFCPSSQESLISIL